VPNVRAVASWTGRLATVLIITTTFMSLEHRAFLEELPAELTPFYGINILTAINPVKFTLDTP